MQLHAVRAGRGIPRRAGTANSSGATVQVLSCTPGKLSSSDPGFEFSRFNVRPNISCWVYNDGLVRIQCTAALVKRACVFNYLRKNVSLFFNDSMKRAIWNMDPCKGLLKDSRKIYAVDLIQIFCGSTVLVNATRAVVCSNVRSAEITVEYACSKIRSGKPNL